MTMAVYFAQQFSEVCEWTIGLECLPPWSGIILQVVCLRDRQTQGACSSLLRALGWTVHAAMTRHLHVVCLHDGAAAMKLQLVEQACTCFTMHGGGGLKVRARLCCREHSDGQCMPP